MPQRDGPRLDGRNGQIWRSYILGHTQEQIAAEHDLSQARVSEIIRAVRESIPDNARADAALLAMERLDALLTSLMPAALEGDIKANGAVLRIIERQCRLLGLDAAEPLRVVLERHRDLEGQLVADALAAALDAVQLTEEQRMAALGAAQAKLLGGDPPAVVPSAPVGPSADDVRRARLEDDFRKFAAEAGFDPDEDDDGEDGQEDGDDGV
jgi:predicted transcriptional regulator